MDGYRKLKAWRLCHALALSVYDATDRFPAAERYGLANQLRRAAVSASANLAEGYARLGPAEFKRFIGISLGSLAEVDVLLLIARARGYVDQERYVTLQAAYLAASKTTYGLLRSLRR